MSGWREKRQARDVRRRARHRRNQAGSRKLQQQINEFSHLFDVDTAMAYMAWFMDESLFGMRVQDVVRSVDYLLSRPDVAKDDWKLTGKGAGALWVLYAAALDPRIQDCTCERGLISYSVACANG